MILANAAVLGPATYPSVVESYGELLVRFEYAFLTVFVVELIVRILAYVVRSRPGLGGFLALSALAQGGAS